MEAHDPREVEIGGRTYLIAPMPATKGLSVLTRLVKLLGPAIGGGLSGGGLSAMLDTKVDDGFVGRLVEALTGRLDEPVVEKLAKDMVASVRVSEDGRVSDLSSSFDRVFAGRMTDLFKLLVEVAGVNYGDFFGGGGLDGLSAKLAGILPPKSVKP